MCKFVNVPEGQERLELEGGFGRRFQKFHLDEQLVLVGNNYQALAENNLTDLVCELRNPVRIEVDNILVSSGIIYVAVAVDAQIELFPVDYKALVQA